MRDNVRRYVVDELGDPGAVLIADDTGDVKSGAHTVGVQRQYTGSGRRQKSALDLGLRASLNVVHAGRRDRHEKDVDEAMPDAHGVLAALTA